MKIRQEIQMAFSHRQIKIIFEMIIIIILSILVAEDLQVGLFYLLLYLSSQIVVYCFKDCIKTVSTIPTGLKYETRNSCCYYYEDVFIKY